MSSELNVVMRQVIESVKSSNMRRTRYGEDLYVRRTDGFEKVYKNNSDLFKAKVKENHSYRKKDFLKTPYNPKSASRVSSEGETTFWKQTNRRSFTRADSGRKTQERINFADITNMQPRKLDFL